MNVLIYFHTESSGSINVALGFPRQEEKMQLSISLELFQKWVQPIWLTMRMLLK